MVTQEKLDPVFKALADPTRRAILFALHEGELAVLAIAKRFPKLSRPAISKHLRILREAGLVDEEQQGRQRYYRLQRVALDTVEAWLEPLVDRSGRSTASGERFAPVSRPMVGASGDDWRVW